MLERENNPLPTDSTIIARGNDWELAQKPLTSTDIKIVLEDRKNDILVPYEFEIDNVSIGGKGNTIEYQNLALITSHTN